MITLETDRLKLRAFRNEDIDAYAEICADPEVMRFLGGKPLNRGEAWRQMALHRPPTSVAAASDPGVHECLAAE